MKIETKTKYEPKAGDVLAWIDGEDRILFIVTSNNIGINGFTLRDNRSITDDKSHYVTFSEQARLSLVLKQDELEDELNEELIKWDRFEEEACSGLSALFD